MKAVVIKKEQSAEKAFSKQSLIFDEIYAENTIVQYKRERVRSHVLQQVKAGGSILELNSGTGEDAVFFARQGFRVHATDLSEGMQEQLKAKVLRQGLTDRISLERCSYTQLDTLQARGPYDLVFSNFAGLNCTDELEKVFQSFVPLLKPGGIVVLVMLPKFCLWELLLIFKGKFRTAFRRFFAKKGRKAHIEGGYFTCWYYNYRDVRRMMPEVLESLDLEGLCAVVPPSYLEGFAEKHPRLYRLLTAWEARWKRSWPWKFMGDYYIASFKKKEC